MQQLHLKLPHCLCAHENGYRSHNFQASHTYIIFKLVPVKLDAVERDIKIYYFHPVLSKIRS